MFNVPKLMTSISGIDITTVEQWEKYRRDEILTLCESYVYGVRDIERPDDLYFSLEKTTEIHGMTKKSLRAGFGSFSFPFYLYLPKENRKPLPVFIYVMHENMENWLKMRDDGNMYADEASSVLPLKYITDRGYAVAVMPTRDIYREWTTHSEFKVGVFAEVNRQRNEHSWASISAWAWGVSRVLNYLETDSDVDASRVASIGHSRSGKAALWAAATDQRIFLAVPNNSGCMGAALLRGKRGEHVKDINISDWFCEKFKDYNEAEELLPVDQHMVLSLIAPRNLYIACSILDEWADPDAELRSARLSSSVWELYGKQGILLDGEPVLNEAYQNGSIAYHVKDGDHSQTMFDWENVINYFDKIK